MTVKAAVAGMFFITARNFNILQIVGKNLSTSLIFVESLSHIVTSPHLLCLHFHESFISHWHNGL